MPWMSIAASVGGSLISGAFGKKSADSAANVQVQATQQQQRMLDEQIARIRGDNAPFRNEGLAANDRLSSLLGLSDPRGTPIYSDPVISRPDAVVRGNSVYTQGGAYMGRYGIDPGVNTIGDLAPTLGVHRILDDQGNEVWKEPQGERQITGYTPNDSSYGSLLKNFTTEDLNADPVYNASLKFGLDQGVGAINSRAIANGSYDSGSTIKALTRYAEDYGAQKAGESYSRFMGDKASTYGMLTGQQAVGQNATNATTGATTSLATAGANSVTDAGNARAAGIVGGANAWGTALNGVGTAFNNYQNNETLKKLLAGRGGSGQSGVTSGVPWYLMGD